jgi:hypothetical protein
LRSTCTRPEVSLGAQRERAPKEILDRRVWV